ncbi:GNAT family N-acetyltransferase [Macrococcus equi]|uniref:GNAT family N-acetyltransferase n=1 Tax=Macrococcus equi TaxID=3395462 RepID=UPI0039BE735A
MNYSLVIPEEKYQSDIIMYKAEFHDRNEVIHGSSSLHRYEDFDEWLETVQNSDNPDRIPYGFVPATQFLCLNEQGKIVGMINIRHYLNEHLTQIGGHIGYSVRPDERRKGIAKWMLQEALKFLKRKDVDKALLTCDYNNIGSKKTILSCNGVYENSVHDEYDNIDVERYWIDIK